MSSIIYGYNSLESMGKKTTAYQYRTVLDLTQVSARTMHLTSWILALVQVFYYVQYEL